MPEPRGWTGCPRRTQSAIRMRDDRSIKGAAIGGQCLGAAAYKPVSSRRRCGKWSIQRRSQSARTGRSMLAISSSDSGPDRIARRRSVLRETDRDKPRCAS